MMGGVLGLMPLACQTIYFYWCAFMTMISLGGQETICGIAGNCIGANNVPLAQRFFRLTLTATMTVMGTLALLTFIFRRNIVKIFTDDEDRIELTSKILIVAAMYIAVDAFQCFM